MIFKLQRAKRVRDPLDGIRLAMSVVVHRINAPFIAGTMMLGVQDSVHHGIAQVEIGRGHINLRAKNARAIEEFSGAHALEQIQILFDRPVAIGTVFSRLSQRAAVFANFIGGEVVDVRFAIFDQFDCPFVELVEIIGRIEQPVPLEAEPIHVSLDGLDVFRFFFLGIGIVEAKVGTSAKFVGQAEVNADGFRVADVQVAVGLGRKTRLHTAVVLVGLEVFENNVADKV